MPDWVRLVMIDSKTRVRQATSAGFAPDEDGLSVYHEPTLIGLNLGAADIATHPMNAVAALPVAAVRTNELGVVRDPNPADVLDPEHDRHDAHCLITGWERCTSNSQSHKLRKALAMAAVLVVDPGAPS